MSKTDPLANLRGASPAITDDAIESMGDRVFVDYDGKTGNEQQFAHTGDFVLLSRGQPFKLRPGLNLLARDVWELYKSDDKVASLRAAGFVRTVSPDLREYPNRTRLLDLVKRTLSADALDYLLELEKAKPHSGPPGPGRQDQRVLELLESRAKAAARTHEPDLSNVLALAGQQSAVLNAKVADARAQAKAG